MNEYFNSSEHNDIGSSEYNSYSEHTTVAEYGEAGSEQYTAQEFSEDSEDALFDGNGRTTRANKQKRNRERLRTISAFVLALGVTGATVLGVVTAAFVRVSRYIVYESALAFEFEIIGYEKADFFVTLTTELDASYGSSDGSDSVEEPYDPYFDENYYFSDASISKEYPYAYFEGLQPETVYLLQIIKFEISSGADRSESKVLFSRTYKTGKEGSGMPDGNPWGEEPWRQEELWQTGTEAHVTVVSRTEESDWVTLMLAVTNPSGVQLTITLGEQVRIITETEGITGVTFERLTPGTEYSFFVADPYGNVLASGTVTTSS